MGVLQLTHSFYYFYYLERANEGNSLKTIFFSCYFFIIFSLFLGSLVFNLYFYYYFFVIFVFYY